METLRVTASTLADGHFDGTITGFGNDDLIDLKGIGAASDATLGAGNVLTVSGGSSTVVLHLDPGQSLAGFVFQVGSDGAGGTDLMLAKAVNGGNGNDLLTGTSGNDIINGGNGNDTINSGEGNDIISGGNGNDTVTAGNGNNVIDGGNGNDTITAGNGNNTITGGNGNETITVGNGNNTIAGGNGNDNVTVGTGNNMVSGGSGNDTFVFKPGFGNDVIADFSHGDHVEFDGVFADFTAIQAAMHQSGADTVISLGVDHSVTLDHVNVTSLHASDFVIV
jgi:Ca2+-binding RTX toxin-like protein